MKASTGGGFRRPKFKRFRARAEAEKWLAGEQAKAGASGGAAGKVKAEVKAEANGSGKSGMKRGREGEEGAAAATAGPVGVKRERVR